MRKLSLISAIILASVLIIFGFNYFFPFIPTPPVENSSGLQLLKIMKEGGLMAFISLSHIVIGILLFSPRFRLIGALLQLPVSIGIVSFHITMQPEGLIFAIILLLLNIGAGLNYEKVLILLSGESNK